MARLPRLGGDEGNWGTILNDYLQVEHNDDGTLKNVANYDTIAALKAATVPSTSGKLAFVRGYYAEGDGGGGTFGYYVSSSATDNGGTIIAPDTGSGRWERILRSRATVTVREFGAKGDSSTDDTTAIQHAMDAVKYTVEGTGNGTVIFEQGSYKITSTLMWAKGVRLLGEQGQSGNTTRWPEIKWYGPAGQDIMQDETTGDNKSFHQMRYLFLRHGDDNARPRYCLYLRDRVDYGWRFEDCSFSGSDSYGVRVDSALNGYFKNFRCDGCLDAGIYVKIVGSSSMCFEDFTIDNYVGTRSGSPSAGGGFIIDGSASTDNEVIHLKIANARLENNSLMAAGNGFIKLLAKPSVSQKLQFHLTLENVSKADGGDITEKNGIVVSPATDFIQLAIRNCQLGPIVGIPSWANSKIGTVGYHVDTIIAPHHTKTGASPDAGQTSLERCGLVNFTGPIYRAGQEALIPSKVATTSLGDNIIVYKGDWFFNAEALTSDSVSLPISIAVENGTTGTLSGVTGSGTIGTTLLTLNTVAGLKLGHYIDIAEANSGVRVTSIDSSANTIGISSNLSASVTDAAITYHAPVYKIATLTLT